MPVLCSMSFGWYTTQYPTDRKYISVAQRQQEPLSEYNVCERATRDRARTMKRMPPLQKAITDAPLPALSVDVALIEIDSYLV